MGYGLLDTIDEALLGDKRLQVVGADVVVYEVFYQIGDVAHHGVVRDIVDEQVFDTQTLFNHGRNHQPEESCQHNANGDKATQDTGYAELQMTAVLEEFDHRKEQIGNEPRQKKRQ